MIWHADCFNAFVMKKTFTILAIGSGLSFSSAQAEIESEFHVGYNSKYIFRGVDLGDDAYEYGLDFAGSCDCGLDWSAGIWGISPDGLGDDELDIYAAVSKDFSNVTISAGFTAYTYDTAADDAELFLGASGSFSGLDAGLTIFFGTDGALEDQILLEGNLGYSHDLSDTVSANLSLTYGAVLDNGDGGFATSDGGAYFSASFGLDFALSDQMTFSPYVSYVDGADRINGVEEEVIGGAILAFSF